MGKKDYYGYGSIKYDFKLNEYIVDPEGVIISIERDYPFKRSSPIYEVLNEFSSYSEFVSPFRVVFHKSSGEITLQSKDGISFDADFTDFSRIVVLPYKGCKVPAFYYVFLDIYGMTDNVEWGVFYPIPRKFIATGQI